MNSYKIAEKYIEDGAIARKDIQLDKVIEVSKIIASAFKNGNKIILMGNGGSAADSQHIAAEFVGRFEKERIALPALALNVNTSTITAIGNDYGYDNIFARQIEAFAMKGDVVFALSTSGNSKNVIEGINKAREKGCVIIGITGRTGGKMSKMIDDNLLFKINSDVTSIIQEITITIGHLISKLVEIEMFGE